ncbi:YcnI family copper-binding membrane protein [Mycobacterium sp.]|uniref:YcnI family copper-binding membrane protein n=1 Tax=Mycobacterium sp. TaxID=1785 RepID=UPI003D6A36AE
MVSRALTAVAVAAVLGVGSAVGIAPASAHVHAVSDNTVRGGRAIVTFSVPNESPAGAATTALTVKLPDVASALTETKPGWAARLDRDPAAGTVRSVTWTAAPADGIGAEQFGLFRISLTLPDTDTVSFPATQSYADGSVVNWDQPPLPGGGEPERPAPRLTLTAGPVAPPEHPTGAADATQQHARPDSAPTGHADNKARLLAGGALLLAALGIAMAVVRRRT